MTIPSLLEALAAGEGPSIEFKSHATDVENIARTVTAFLNSGGGAIYCGVDETGKVIPSKKANLEAVARNLELKLKERITPTGVFSVTLDQVEGQPFMTVDVPKGADPPYVVDGAVFIRHGAQTRAATSVELRRMLREQGEIGERWERRPSPMMEIEDIDHDEVRRAVREIGEFKRIALSQPGDDLEVLRDLSMWNTTGFTQGCDVVFSKNPARRNPQCRVQFVSFQTGKADSEYSNFKWLEGPLVRVFNQVMDLLEASNAVKARFIGESVQRQDLPAYSSEALREGVVNAFVHRDYAAYSGGLKVSVFPDRVEIWNSGHLPAGFDTKVLSRSHPSVLINPDISHVFYARGMMERTGRGAELLVEYCDRLGAKQPQWSDGPTGVTLTIYSSTTGGKLNARQEKLLAALHRGQTITLLEYHARFAAEVTERQARRDLQELDRIGELFMEGKGPSTLYRRPLLGARR